MGFESVHITSANFDRAEAERWLGEQPWAFADPFGTGQWHISGRAQAAKAARDARAADASRFPPGVVVFPKDGGLTLEARADAATFVRTRQFLEACVPADAVMRRDTNDEDEPFDLDVLISLELPSAEELEDDPFARPVTEGQIVTWAVGDDDDPAGRWELEVHSSGALHMSHSVGTKVVREVRKELSPLARLAWLEAAAHLDEDDDEVEEVLPPSRVVCVTVERDDDMWSLYMDAQAPSPSAAPLAELVAQWRMVLDKAAPA
ncbi:MAG: hypothetical protein EP330_06090 [Deltaproteobacteria bacterium]|nr:MAG: hypothetical protein EP330_06090 [Deltaproteobacteria bacterium]